MTGYPAAFAAAGSGLPVGSEIGATRFVIDQTEPASLARSRYLVGTFCLLPPMLMSVRVRIEGRDFLPICLLGITQFGILTALLNFGLQYIGSAPAALIFSTFPLMTMVLAALLGYEALTLLKSAGVGLTIVGVAFALTEKLTLLEESPSWTGEAAVFASALCGAVRSVFYRPCLREYPALQVGAMAMIAGHDRLLAFSGHTGGIRGVFRFDA